MDLGVMTDTIFELQKEPKIMSIYEYKTQLQLGPKWSSFLCIFLEIEADTKLVWVCHAVIKTRFLFVSRQYFKTQDYIRNE